MRPAWDIHQSGDDEPASAEPVVRPNSCVTDGPPRRERMGRLPGGMVGVCVLSELMLTGPPVFRQLDFNDVE